MFQNSLLSTVLLICFSANVGLAQQNAKADELATVVGKLTLQNDIDFKKVKIVEQRLIMLEEFVPSIPPLPKSFADLEPEKKNAFYQKWLESEQGQAFLKAEDKRFANLKKFEQKADASGSFQFKKVPSGKYDLAGELEFKYQSKTYFADFAAKVKVGDVAEVKLSAIALSPARVFLAGEKVPDVKIKTTTGQTLKLSTKKPTFLFFASQQHPLIDKLMDQLKNHPDKMVMIFVVQESQLDVWAKALKERGLRANLATFKNLSDPVCKSFHLTLLPSAWVIQKGKILASERDFQNAQFDLTKALKK